jgi:DNA replicative helicase MCM subunit Mcm2 (Cdc46/Mcm family)
MYERYDLKLALLLCLIGGSSNNFNNTQIRGNSHMLIIGEPGNID